MFKYTTHLLDVFKHTSRIEHFMQHTRTFTSWCVLVDTGFPRATRAVLPPPVHLAEVKGRQIEVARVAQFIFG